MDRLTCNDYVNFGNCEDKFGRLPWPKIDCNCLDVVVKDFDYVDTKNDIKSSNEKEDFNQFSRLPSEAVDTIEHFRREKKGVWSTVSKKKPRTWKNNRKICVTLLRYTISKPGSSSAAVRVIVRKKEDEKFNKMFMWITILMTLTI